MQQINLYQPIFRKQKKVFTAVAMLQVTAFVFLVLTAIYAYNWWQLQPFEQQIKRATAEHQQLQQQVSDLRAQAKKDTKSQLLEDEVKKLRRELTRKREVNAMLSEGRFGNQAGFSSLWEGLARQHIEGLWLTSVRLEKGGRQMMLSGRTISAELVPMYIQKLSSEEAFSGLSFNVLELNRDEDNPSVIRFNLGTSQGDKVRNG